MIDTTTTTFTALDIRPKWTDLNAMLTTEEAAQWFGTAPKTLLAASKGRFPTVPALRPNKKFVRWCPRIIIARMAHDAGVPVSVIAAAMGVAMEGEKKI